MKFAAHIRETDNKEQTVTAHCMETAQLAAGYARSLGLESAGKIAGILHDIGKLTADFNDYIHQRLNIPRGTLDHSFAGAKYLHETAQKTDRKDVRFAAGLIGRVILSHHGLHDWLNEDGEDVYQNRTAKQKYYDEITENLRQTVLPEHTEELLLQAAAEIRDLREKIAEIAKQSKNVNEALCFYYGMLERLLQSVLIDADRTNTADFMSGTQTEQHFDTQKLWQDMEERMTEKLKELEKNCDKNDAIFLQRNSISERCAAFADHTVRICRLVVPTGGGKTLSSLRFAIRYAKSHPAERIFYIAPFMSILEQNSDIIRALVGEDAFLEHHSNILAEVSADDGELHEYELRTEKWDSPVIATTMVQFLNALFSGKTAAVRRMHRLSRAVIIVDEVQSVPLKCVYLFNLAMNFLTHICGSTVVLCSATQPPYEKMPEFPVLPDQQSSMTGEYQTDFDVFRRTKLIFSGRTTGYSYDEAAGFCAEKFEENGSLLCIVNTKAAAREMYRRLAETPGASVFHLSTNMCPAHRNQKIREMKELLSVHCPVICVTTQLIEAGVDISFGCVVRSMAGLDNAAQAAGRCNRSGEFHRICPVYMLKLWEEKLGSLAEINNA